MVIDIPRITSVVNWSDIEDEEDLEMWDRLTGNFWLPEEIPLSNNIPSWKTLNADEELVTNQVFTGLILLDTIQDTVGAVSLIPDSKTPYGEAVYINIAFMESARTRSYSSIFSTLLSTEETNEFFQWSRNNESSQRKAHIVLDYYHGDDVEKRKVASAVLESFLSCNGSYAPMHWSTHAKLTDTADLIRLIIRDEAVHGHYIDYKSQVTMRESLSSRQEELHDYMYSLLTDLHDNEVLYTEILYGILGLTEDVKKFLHHNANRALVNLGYEALPPPGEIDMNPAILAALSPTAEENHDFFSGSGLSYTVGTAGETEGEDWEF